MDDGSGQPPAQLRFRQQNRARSSRLQAEERSKMEEERATTLEGEWRNTVMRRFDRIEVQIDRDREESARQVDHLFEQLRTEHLDKSTYVVSNAALTERITRLENGPSRWVPWVALGVSAVLGCAGLLIAGVAALGTIAGVLFAILHS